MIDKLTTLRYNMNVDRYLCLYGMRYIKLAMCFCSVVLMTYNSDASINDEKDFHWSLVKLSVQTDLSDTMCRCVYNHNVYDEMQKDPNYGWYARGIYMKNIMENIPHMIADCVLKRNIFANVKEDGIVRFENSDVSSYTDANKNAYLLCNYIYIALYGDKKLSIEDIAKVLSENGKYDFTKPTSDINKYVKDLMLTNLDQYKDINTIKNIKIEKGYKNGEAKFRFTNSMIYTDFKYKQYFCVFQRTVQWQDKNNNEQFAYGYLKDKQLVISYKNEIIYKNAPKDPLTYFTIQDDYLNTRIYFDFEPPRFTIYDDKNLNEITIDAWENRNNEYLDFDWTNEYLNEYYYDLQGKKVK